MKTLFELNSIIENDVKKWYDLYIEKEGAYPDSTKATGFFKPDPYLSLKFAVRDLFNEYNDLQQKLIKAQSELINRMIRDCDDC